MDVTIHGRNLSVSPRLESYIERKVQKLDRYLPDIQEVRVDLADDTGRGGDRQKAQITVRHSRGKVLRAEEVSSDITASVDTAVDRIYRQIEKYKGKRRRRGESTPTFEGLETAIQLEEDEFESGTIVRRKRFPLAAMHEEEAIEQLELLGHDFFVFLNGDTGDINVLYRRHDDNYGLLEPEA